MVIWLALSACTPQPSPSGGVPTDEPVVSPLPDPDPVTCDELDEAFVSCQACHGASPVYGPSFEDPSTSVGQPSLQSSLPLVAAGDPDGSYLLHKLRDTQDSVGGSGTVMPPSGQLEAAMLERVERWVAEGADCAPEADTDTDTDADSDTDADTDADSDADADTDSDTDTDTDTDADTDPGTTPTCAEVDLAFASCTGCHGPNGLGGLSLVAPADVVGQASSQAAMPLVVPFDADGSYLIHKVRGTHASVGGSGTLMPPGTVPASALVATFEAWVDAGAVCDGDADTDTDTDTDTDADADADADTDPVDPATCEEAQGVVDQACTACHGQQTYAGLDLRQIADVIDQPATQATLDLVEPGDRTASYLWRKLEGTHGAAGGSGTAMPPSASLSAQDLQIVGSWIDDGAVCATGPVVPPDEIGLTPRFSRLTHTQWENTMQDLLGVGPTGLSDGFIGDTLSSGGFDNDGRLLQVSAELWGDYQRAAEALAKTVVNDAALYEALVPQDPDADAILDPPIRLEAESDLTPTTGGQSGSTGWNVWSNGEVWADQDLTPGDWVLAARVFGQRAGPDLPRVQLRVDGVALLQTDVQGQSLGEADIVEVPFTATGTHRVAAAFVNDFWDETLGDRNLVVDWIELRPQIDTTYDPVTDLPAATDFITTFGAKAYRRPLTTAEVDAYVDLFEVGVTLEYTGIPFRDGIYTVLVAMLQSPHVVYRVEQESTPDGTGDIPLDAYTLASKLSYGLWNTMPDEALFQAAANGTLTDPLVLEAEAERLLNDPRAVASIDHFHHQLLQLDNYANIHKDTSVFPQWNESLNEHMVEEARLYTRNAVTSGASIFEFFTDPHTYVGPELAPFYGVSVTGPDPELVQLDPSQRAGLLTQLGFLSVNAHAAQVDSIHRGVFVNLKLLCSDLPPPPNMVPPLPAPVPGLTNRERVDQHTGPGTCGAGCHSTMINPIGFAFENYDALGQWQTIDAGQTIDSSGTFGFSTGPASWTDTVGFAALLGDSLDAHRCLVGNWLRYTHGRELSEEDENLVERLAGEARTADTPLRDILLDLVTTPSFRYRAPEATP